MPTLFDPIQIGELVLPNRIVMAPLTRDRATGTIPTDLMTAYYRQRASAGLIITQASPNSRMAHGYLDTPGMHSPQQIAAWRQVTNAVHSAGGRIVNQLWHVGRISHSSLLPDGVPPVSSTARNAKSQTFIHEGFVPTSDPRALRDDEIPGVVMAAVCSEIGPGRVGVRLSPATTIRGSAPLDSDTAALYGYVIDQVSSMDLAYVHVIEGETGGARQSEGVSFDYSALRSRFNGSWMVNNGYDRNSGTSPRTLGHLPFHSSRTNRAGS